MERTLVVLVRAPTDKGHDGQRDHIARDHQQVGNQGGHAQVQVLDNQRRQDRQGVEGQETKEADQDIGPDLGTRQGSHELFERNDSFAGFGFGGVILDQTSDRNLFLAVREISIETEPAPGRRWPLGQDEEGKGTDQDRGQTFKQEQPPPSGFSCHSSHVKNTKGEDTSDSVGNSKCAPKDGQARSHLVTLVVRGQVDGNAWDVSCLKHAHKCATEQKSETIFEEELSGR